MKLKKAIREYARAVDDLAFATNAMILADMDSCSPEVLEALVHWRDEARREKKRAVRQMNAVMSAMQYRGRRNFALLQPSVEITGLRGLDDVALLMVRTKWNPYGTDATNEKCLQIAVSWGKKHDIHFRYILDAAEIAEQLQINLSDYKQGVFEDNDA